MPSSLISYVDRSTLALLAPTILKETHLTGEQYGLIISAFSIAYMLSNPLWGWILDRAGLSDVPVEEVPGQLTDHYDPTKRALFLSAENFRGRSVVITGGSRGLGLLIARELGRQGARLTLAARDLGALGCRSDRARSTARSVDSLSNNESH